MKIAAPIPTLGNIGPTDNVPMPTDWQQTSLDELLDFRNGVNAGKAAYGSGTPFANVLEVISKSHLHASDFCGLVALPTKVIRSYSLKRGDVLFNRTSETQQEIGLASVYLDDETAVFGGFVIRGRQKTAQLNDCFAGYCLRSNSVRTQMISKGQGAIHYNIGQVDLKKVNIALPPVPEQEGIATALSDVDALIGSLEKLIAKKHAVRLATMQQLLGGKTRLPGFSNEWRTTTLEEVGKTYSGLAGKKKQDFGKGNARYIPFLNVINNVVLDPSHLEYVNVSSLENQNSVRGGDLFFNGSSETADEVGMAAVLLEDLENVYLNSFCFGFRFNERTDENPLFWAYYLRGGEGRRLLYSEAQGAIRYNISKTRFVKLALRIPDRDEQDAICGILTDMTTEIQALDRQRDKMRGIKQGMSQLLLTGRIRIRTSEALV